VSDNSVRTDREENDDVSDNEKNFKVEITPKTLQTNLIEENKLKEEANS